MTTVKTAVMMTATVAVTLGAAAAAAEVVQLDAESVDRAGVSVEEVALRSFEERTRVVGQIVRAPGSTVTVKAIVPGRVEQLFASPGEPVSAGEQLLSLHSHEMLAMQGELLRAAERRRLATARLEAGRELFRIDGISRMDLRVREEESSSAEIGFSALREELIDHGLDETTVDRILDTRTPDPHLPVTSPIDGVVLELSAQLHEWVRDYEPLMVVGDPVRIELELQLAPDLVSGVAAGDRVRFAPVGAPNGLSDAVVTTRVPQVDPVTRTVRIRARISSDDDGLFPGVFVEGELSHGDARMAPAVPESAVINLGGDDVVFVETGPGRFEPRRTVLGILSGGMYEVVSGVEAGDDVASSGVFFLKSALVKGEDG